MHSVRQSASPSPNRRALEPASWHALFGSAPHDRVGDAAPEYLCHCGTQCLSPSAADIARCVHAADAARYLHATGHVCGHAKAAAAWLCGYRTIASRSSRCCGSTIHTYAAAPAIVQAAKPRDVKKPNDSDANCTCSVVRTRSLQPLEQQAPLREYPLSKRQLFHRWQVVFRTISIEDTT